MLTLLVALGAGIGAVARYTVDRAVSARHRADFPYGTFVINISGSLLLGFLVGVAPHNDAATIAGGGFAGGYTTLSTWAWETVALTERRELTSAVVNVVGSLALGIAAAAAGLGLALL